MKLLMLVGLPASGKSFFAKDLVENNPGKRKRTNKDEIRMLVDNGRWSKLNEKIVLDIRDFIIEQSLINGISIVVDDTGFAPFHEVRLRELATKHKAKFEIKFFDTPIQTCLERDSKRANPVGAEVIRKMYNQYIKKENSFKQLPTIEGLLECIIVDVDGTLAYHAERGPYEMEKLSTDTVIRPVRSIIYMFENRYAVILMSGRSEDYREGTEKRLKDNDINYHQLYMRPSGDERNDTIIKQELYEKHIKGKYNVLYCLDDRKRVIKTRRDLGLFTLDCNQEDNYF